MIATKVVIITTRTENKHLISNIEKSGIEIN